MTNQAYAATPESLHAEQDQAKTQDQVPDAQAAAWPLPTLNPRQFAEQAEAASVAATPKQEEYECATPGEVDAAAADCRALFDALSKVRHKYPEILRNSNNDGEVRVKLLLDAQGQVRRMEVLESDHVEFEKQAIRELAFTRYPAAVFAGKGVPVGLILPIQYMLIDLGVQSVQSFSTFAFAKTGSKTLPPEFQYDTPPKVQIASAAIYPAELLAQKRKGTAKVSAIIDPDGVVRQVKVLQATYPEFGYATQAMIYASKFIPAHKQGQPSWATFSFQQEFNNGDTHINLEETLRFYSESKGSGVVKLAELDKQVRPLFQVLPEYPADFPKLAKPQRVLLEFYIDKDGTVKLPRVLSAPTPELGFIAATSLARWQFERPTRQQKPIIAKLQIPFIFE